MTTENVESAQGLLNIPEATQLKALSPEKVTDLSQQLSVGLKESGNKILHTPQTRAQEKAFLKMTLEKEKKGLLSKSRVNIKDKDQLWATVHVLYSDKQAAETAYFIVRSAQIVLQGGPMPQNIDAKGIRERFMIDPKIDPRGAFYLGQFNQHRIFLGESAALKLLSDLMPKESAGVETPSAVATPHGESPAETQSAETAPAAPVNVESFSPERLQNLANAIERLRKKKGLVICQQRLAEQIIELHALTATEKMVQSELDLIQAAGTRRRLGATEFANRDRLWLLVNTIYPKKNERDHRAEMLYRVIRTAQLRALEQPINHDLNDEARTSVQAIQQHIERADRVRMELFKTMNSAQFIAGPHALIKMLEEVVLNTDSIFSAVEAYSRATGIRDPKTIIERLLNPSPSPESQLTQSILNIPAQDFNRLAENSQWYLARLEQRKQAQPKIKPAQRLLLAATIALAGGTGLAALRPSQSTSTPEKTAITAAAPTRSPGLNLTLTPPTASGTEAATKPAPETKTYTGDLIKDVIVPALYKDTEKRRAEKQQQEQDWSKRVNAELNKGRVNFLVLVTGSEKDAQYTDSIIVVSYSLSDHTIHLFSIPRDTYAPEVDRFKQQKNIGTPKWNAINTAFANGGFPLIREAVENTTGLSADYTLKLTIEAISELVDKVFGKVKINVKETIDDRPDYPVYFPQGIHEMSGQQLQHYLRSRQSTSEIARNWRQQETIEILMDTFLERFKKGDMGILQKALQTYNAIKANPDRRLETDLDIDTILKEKSADFFGSIFEAGGTLISALKQGRLLPTLSKPSITRSVFEPQKTLEWDEREEVIDMRPHLLRVMGGDAGTPNLAQDYWGATRKLVRERLFGRQL